MTNKSSNGHNSSSGTKKVILNNDNPTAKPDPAWFIGAKKAFKPFYWIAGFVLLWCTVSFFQVIDPNIIASITLLISALIFILSIPVGIFLRMDVLADHYAASFSTEAVLIFSLPILLLNFLLIGAYMGWRGKFQKNAKTSNKT